MMLMRRFGLRVGGESADESRVMTGATPPQPTREDSDRDRGYRAAISDAIAIVDAIGGSSTQNLSAPVLRRLKARLAGLLAGDESRAA